MKPFFTYTKRALAAAAIILLSFILSPHCTAQTIVYYGMTSTDGLNNAGVIFRFDPAKDTEAVVYNFGDNGNNDGSGPTGSLTYYPPNGLFYGMSPQGGMDEVGGVGTIFSFNPANNVEKVEYNFQGIPDGATPYGNLVYDTSSGLLFGLTAFGGSINNQGSIFSFNPTNGTEKVLYGFGTSQQDATGQPYASMTWCPLNQLYYGMTTLTIFSFNPANNAENVVWGFGSGTDGYIAIRDFVYDAGTKLLYGTTVRGGTHDSGTIISFNPLNNTENVLWNFGEGNDGCFGSSNGGGLVYDPANELFYGMTTACGTDGYGVIYSFNPADSSENVLYNFQGPPVDGKNPTGRMIYNSANKLLYGMTTYGDDLGYFSSVNAGTIFSFNPSDNAEKQLWDFTKRTNDEDGWFPMGDLTPYTSTGAGINEVHIPGSIDIYPNPTTGQINITGLSTGQTVELYNDLGQHINSSKSKNALQQLDISAQANGVYLVQVLNEDGTIADQKKVIKIN